MKPTYEEFVKQKYLESLSQGELPQNNSSSGVPNINDEARKATLATLAKIQQMAADTKSPLYKQGAKIAIKTPSNEDLEAFKLNKARNELSMRDYEVNRDAYTKNIANVNEYNKKADDWNELAYGDATRQKYDLPEYMGRNPYTGDNTASRAQKKDLPYFDKKYEGTELKYPGETTANIDITAAPPAAPREHKEPKNSPYDFSFGKYEETTNQDGTKSKSGKFTNEHELKQFNRPNGIGLDNVIEWAAQGDPVDIQTAADSNETANYTDVGANALKTRTDWIVPKDMQDDAKDSQGNVIKGLGKTFKGTQDQYIKKLRDYFIKLVPNSYARSAYNEGFYGDPKDESNFNNKKKVATELRDLLMEAGIANKGKLVKISKGDKDREDAVHFWVANNLLRQISRIKYGR
jgi:hypothetical protein